MDRHHVRFGQQRPLAGGAPDAGLGAAPLGQVGAPGGDFHAERLADRRDLAAETAQPDHAERLAAKPGADGALPSPVPDRAVLEGERPGGRQDQPPGQLGRRIAERRRAADDDAALPRRADVDRQVAHPAGQQQFELRQLLELGARERRALPHRADDLEPAEGARDRVLPADTGVEDLDLDLAGQDRPIGHAERAALIVVDDRATFHRVPRPRPAGGYAGRGRGRENRLAPPARRRHIGRGPLPGASCSRKSSFAARANTTSRTST